MRASDPSTTGTAVRNSASVYERPRSFLNVFANGAIKLHAVKHKANATVARTTLRVADGLSVTVGDDNSELAGARRGRLRILNRRPDLSPTSQSLTRE